MFFGGYCLFTGLIESKGKVIKQGKNGVYNTLFIKTETLFDDLNIGQIIAVNGVCLTLTDFSQTELRFDVMYQTLQSTNLIHLRQNDIVNIERALKVSDRLDGHIVSGHVDATLKIKRIIISEKGYDVWFRLPSKYSSLIFKKCSVALDGVSLTVQKVRKAGVLKEFSVSLIPETLKSTSFLNKKANSIVNIEFDTMIKATQNIKENESDISIEDLKKMGF
ncbi:MAG: riboflavin synthase [Candidatus Muiribacterium halophilum]|uniref:Riboflavin synthase n=1 Tax=Muiribacterium halophilum TaxID=2053465 RepID=A0A2N5ZFI9_MUIH1|nr:MAG: riboflavin synthase [Candidatus Muirbacterium halophilum]